MRADYDVVILGDSYSARWAALYAIRQHARVALVLQSAARPVAFPATLQALADLVTASRAQSHSLPFTSISELREWMHRQDKADLVGLELTRLSQFGVDVIPEPGHFIEASRTAPIFAVQNRQLRSRRYLLACDPVPRQIASSPDKYYSQTSFLAALEKLKPPAKIHLACRYSWVLTLGQVLNTLGYHVTLSSRNSLLPFEDPDVSFFVQCGLEAEGIQVLQESDENEQTGDVHFDPQGASTIESLKLHNIIQLDPSHSEPNLQIRSDLRTDHSRIYVAANQLQTVPSIEETQHYTAIALNNLLFDLETTWEQHPITQSIPVGVGMCRRGLTEPEARHRFSDVEVLVRSAEIATETIFCKLVARGSGEIVGMHLLGLPGRYGQALLQQIFAQSCSMSQLDEVVIAHPALQQILNDFADRWRQIKFPQIRDRRERYFRAKRKRFS